MKYVNITMSKISNNYYIIKLSYLVFIFRHGIDGLDLKGIGGEWRGSTVVPYLVAALVVMALVGSWCSREEEEGLKDE